MTLELAKRSRRFRVGTTGWTAADLDDPRIDARWERGHYEIVEGVLTQMPPAYFDGALALKRLIRAVDGAIASTDPEGELVTEVDLILDPMRVSRVDAVYLSQDDRRAQREANAARGRRNLRYGRILVPPTLIIESLSIGHEAHDRLTKRRWYAEAKVPNYWLLNPYDRSLQCLVLDAGAGYRTDVEGRGEDSLRPTAFPGPLIPLGKLWTE